MHNQRPDFARPDFARPDFRLGLLSITFRKLSPAQIVDLVKQADLTQIEWGGDIHSPHGDISTARAVRQLCTDQGIRVASYGSYFRLLGDNPPFEKVLDSAVELGAPFIRVWPGVKGSADTTQEEFSRAVDQARDIATLAATANVKIAVEYHSHTITDSVEVARQFYDQVNHPHVVSLWQPSNHMSLSERSMALESMKSRLVATHVFQWGPNSSRQPLETGSGEWPVYLKTLGALGRPVDLMMEFVKDDSPQQFLADAEVLKRWARGSC
jgi:3-dehydroshikimate dehydratase